MTELLSILAAYLFGAACGVTIVACILFSQEDGHNDK